MKAITALFFAACIASPGLLATTIYTTGFETSEGYSTGVLSGQAGWFSATLPAVQNTTAHSGTQAVSVTSTGAGQFLTGQNVSYSAITNPEQIANVEVWFMYTPGTGNIAWNPLAVFGTSGFLGQVRVDNGNIGLGLGSNIVGVTALTPGVWHNVLFSFDFQTNTKSAFLDNILLATLPFGNVSTGLTTIAIGQNGGGVNSGNIAYWDDLSVSSVVAPVPEPGAMALTLAGLAALVAVRRRY